MAGGLSLCTNPTFPLLTLFEKQKQKKRVYVKWLLYDFVSVIFVGQYSTMLSAYQLIFLYNFCKGA